MAGEVVSVTFFYVDDSYPIGVQLGVNPGNGFLGRLQPGWTWLGNTIQPVVANDLVALENPGARVRPATESERRALRHVARH